MDFDDIGLELDDNAPQESGSKTKAAKPDPQSRLLDAIDDFDNLPGHSRANNAFSAISSKGSRLKGAAAKEGDSESDDEFGLKDAKIEVAANDDNDDDDDDDFFDSDEDREAKPKAAKTVKTKTSSLPQPSTAASAEKLPIDVTAAPINPIAKLDFKRFMSCTLDQQKKKNQISEQTIAERADESDEECKSSAEQPTANKPQIGYRSRMSKITRLADESTQEHREQLKQLNIQR